ncbi:hypothetical protein ANN_21720 [Periplaneta americana]|uniref:Endonuclease-reverse transcriptase n=1 Tax=Periplaneta americana TaxID=6978 RepID=A0ABQ8S691_PERAM|nr:hypothetical protein ANN_21720 [Periplaneta americana]
MDERRRVSGKVQTREELLQRILDAAETIRDKRVKLRNATSAVCVCICGIEICSSDLKKLVDFTMVTPTDTISTDIPETNHRSCCQNPISANVYRCSESILVKALERRNSFQRARDIEKKDIQVGLWKVSDNTNVRRPGKNNTFTKKIVSQELIILEGYGLASFVVKLMVHKDCISRSCPLLKKCLRGRTQNTNQSFDDIVWYRVPKNVFVDMPTLELGVLDAVLTFNHRYTSRIQVLKNLGIQIGYDIAKNMANLDILRIRKAEIAVTNTTKEARSKKMRPALGEQDEKMRTTTRRVLIVTYVTRAVVLYGCETWTLTLREEHRLRVFENKVLRQIFGAKRDEVTGEWRKLHNTELHALYSSPDIIRNIKSRRLRWAGHVARMGESRNAYRVLVGRPEGKRPLGRPRRRWKDNIKMNLREVGYDDRDWINLAQDRDQWRAYVRAAMNHRVP